MVGQILDERVAVLLSQCLLVFCVGFIGCLIVSVAGKNGDRINLSDQQLFGTTLRSWRRGVNKAAKSV